MASSIWNARVKLSCVVQGKGLSHKTSSFIRLQSALRYGTGSSSHLSCATGHELAWIVGEQALTEGFEKNSRAKVLQVA